VDAGAFLSTVAAGEPQPPLPAGLPQELAGILEALAEAVAGPAEPAAASEAK
jgi:hypothetical protein